MVLLTELDESILDKHMVDIDSIKNSLCPELPPAPNSLRRGILRLMSTTIRVVIADDEVGYRNAIQRTLTLMPECEVIGVCKDGQEALDLCLSDPPNVLCTDINMPRMAG